MQINGRLVAVAVCTLVAASHHARAASLVNAAGASVCLEVKGATIANQTVVQSNVCSDSFGQKWILSNGNIQSQGGQCLAVANNGTGANTGVVTFTCNTGGNELWNYTNGTIVGVGSGKCLDSKGGAAGVQAVINPCSSASSQQWSIR